ncbi:MAG TPA: SH3 domain-containing protein [Pyrinomonadaceae bacterium]|jgi:hypothetical protein|nr:SH3 domain-containing protein [Pyrinomonadaceae bacterium]
MNLPTVNRVSAGLLASLALGLSVAAQEVKLEPAQQKITVASNVRARGGPETSAAEVTRLKLGTVLTATARSADEVEIGGRRGRWYLVSLPAGGTGWVFGGLLADYDAARRGDITRGIIADRLKAETMSFEEGVDLYNLASAAAAEAKSAAERAGLELSVLRALDRSVLAVPYDKREQAPYRDWLKAHDKEVVYHEFSGNYQVASEAMWALEKKYSGTPAGEEIAWAAAQNPIPSDCESDEVCAFLYLSETDGRYLSLYPAGAHAAEAAEGLQRALESPQLKETLDTKNPDQYVAQDQKSLRKALTDLRAAVSKSSLPAKTAILNRINQLMPAGR